MTREAKGSLLIVEDNELFRKLMRSLLQERFPNVDIAEAADLKEGTESASKSHPEVVFVDIGLPDGSGFELARQVRDDAPATEVFVFTATDTPEYRDAARNSGASQFFAKDELDWDEVGRLTEAAFSKWDN